MEASQAAAEAERDSSLARSIFGTNFSSPTLFPGNAKNVALIEGFLV